jgi:hypothetical protein
MPDYRALVEKEITASGLSEDAATAETLRRIPSWDELRADLLEAEPVLRMAHPQHAPLPGDAKTALVAVLLRTYGSGMLVELRMSARRLWKSRRC